MPTCSGPVVLVDDLVGGAMAVRYGMEVEGMGMSRAKYM